MWPLARGYDNAIHTELKTPECGMPSAHHRGECDLTVDREADLRQQLRD